MGWFGWFEVWNRRGFGNLEEMVVKVVVDLFVRARDTRLLTSACFVQTFRF